MTIGSSQGNLVRKTNQRTAILDVFRKLNRPLLPQEAHEAAETKVPGLGIATVYRALKLFTEQGKLRVVEVPGSQPRYEIAGKPHHHHFHCRACDGVFDLHGCIQAVEKLGPSGFQVEDHEIILYGLCASCVEVDEGVSSPSEK